MEEGAMAVLSLPHVPASAAAARRRLAHELTMLGVAPAVVADAELVITELVGNAVRHARPLAGGKVCAGWELAGGALFLRVTDGGAATHAIVRRTADPLDDESGRGLAIVSAIATDWGSESDGARLRTWATIDLS